MTTRGIDLLQKWMAEHLPSGFTDDPAAISDLTDQAMKAAYRKGISSAEIAEDVDSVFEVIADAMQYREDDSGIA